MSLPAMAPLTKGPAHNRRTRTVQSIQHARRDLRPVDGRLGSRLALGCFPATTTDRTNAAPHAMVDPAQPRLEECKRGIRTGKPRAPLGAAKHRRFNGLYGTAVEGRLLVGEPGRERRGVTCRSVGR